MTFGNTFPAISLTSFYHFDTCPSTNDTAFEKLIEDEHAFVWTENQTKGRGSRGRSWTSPQNASLAFSMGWKKGPSPADFPYPIFGGVFAYNVLVNLCPSIKRDLKLKWPNDVLLKGKKLCGILCESKWKGTSEVQTVVGVGMNLKNHAALQLIEQPTTTLEAYGFSLSADHIVEEAHAELQRSHSLQPQSINQLWLEASIWKIGTRLKISDGDTDTEGHFAGLSTQGAFLLHCLNGEAIEIHHAGANFKVTVQSQ